MCPDRPTSTPTLCEGRGRALGAGLIGEKWEELEAVRMMVSDNMHMVCNIVGRGY